MTSPHLDPLRAMIAPWQIQFGQRLLAHSRAGEPIRFSAFVAVAEDFLRLAPDILPRYLAALVALDVAADAGRNPPTTGRN